MSELCPDGVEYDLLVRHVDILRGKRLTRKELVEGGKYPVLHGGTSPMGYYSDFNRKENTTVVVNTGNAGYVLFSDKKFWSSDACFSLYPHEELDDKFLYYVVKNQEDILYSRIRKAAMPTIDAKAVENLLIPIPPLEVQAEIVRILDKWSDAQNGLIALISRELDLRRQQYSYYLDKLLTFGENIPRVPLGELFHTRNGYTPSKLSPDFWENGSVPWFRMDDIRANGRILSDSLQHVTPDAVKGCPFPANSLIISTSATIGEHALITADFLANQRFTVLTLKEEYREKFNIMFLYYCCYELGRWCRKNTHKGSFESVDMDKFRLFRFPFPPLDVQAKIVSILNKWGGSHNGLIATLESELAARKKQYSHYLDKLLDFHTHTQD